MSVTRLFVWLGLEDAPLWAGVFRRRSGRAPTQHLPSAGHPVLAFAPFAVGEVLQLAGRRIEVLLPAEHTVPAVRFVVLSEGGACVYSGNTGSYPALWARPTTLL